MTDDEILDALDRRLSGVESRLPPTPVSVGGRALDGRTMRPGPSFRAGPVPAALALVAVVVAALALGSRLSVGVGAVASAPVEPTADVGSASQAAPSPEITPSVAPSASKGALVILRGEYDGSHLLTEHFGLGPTMCGFDAFMVPLDGAAVDAAIELTGAEEGWVQVPVPYTKHPSTVRVWVGRTVESAAVASGATVLALGGRGDAWINVGNRMGRELRSAPTPKHRLFWFLSGGIGDGACRANPG